MARYCMKKRIITLLLVATLLLGLASCVEAPRKLYDYRRISNGSHFVYANILFGDGVSTLRP